MSFLFFHAKVSNVGHIDCFNLQENMAAGEEDFDSWLSIKLKALNTDEGVFGSYIKGILAGEEETAEDKTEALEGILSEITENDIPAHCREIMEKWQTVAQIATSGKQDSANDVEDVDVKLARLLESQARPAAVQKTYTEEERRIREAILAQYSQMSDQEEDGDPVEGEGKENGLTRNTNAAVVAQAEKEKREKAKADSQRKKEKDKEDREKQKQLAQEKKEKRKTQKGERRR